MRLSAKLPCSIHTRAPITVYERFTEKILRKPDFVSVHNMCRMLMLYINRYRPYQCLQSQSAISLQKQETTRRKINEGFTRQGPYCTKQINGMLMKKKTISPSGFNLPAEMWSSFMSFFLLMLTYPMPSFEALRWACHSRQKPPLPYSDQASASTG